MAGRLCKTDFQNNLKITEKQTFVQKKKIILIAEYFLSFKTPLPTHIKTVRNTLLDLPSRARFH